MQRSTSSRSIVIVAAGFCAATAFGCAGGSSGPGGVGGATGGGAGPGSGGRSSFGSGGIAGPGTGGGVGPGTGGGGVAPGTGGGIGPGSGGTAAGGTNAGTGGTAAGGSTRGACAPASIDVLSDFEENQGVMVRQGTPPRTGWWYTYYPGSPLPIMGGMMQSPPRLDGPIAVAADPMATNPACNKALHVTGSGFNTATGNYSGFGAAFVAPATPTSQVKSPYDLTAYTGISFKIRSGSAMSQPSVYFEVVTRETQPATSGGTATVMTIDLNNNRGYMVAPPLSPAITGSWQTVTVPFGQLIPRWLPAVGGMACPPAAAGVPRCQAPKFNPANVLGFQFSILADAGFPRPAGSTLGTYDLWVDDVTLVKADAGLPTLPGFPNDGPVGTCVKPTGANGKFLVQAYNIWKQTFVVPAAGGFRVQRPEVNNDTVSEGIAYGMLIAVYMNDKPLFDGLWTYWKSLPVGGTMGPLMVWNSTGGQGTATDSDEDAAFAMLQASKKWAGGMDAAGVSYATNALNLMHGVLASDMAGSFIKGGSNYGAGDVTNPSYFAPAYYRVFATADPANAAAWTGLANGAYTLLNNISATSANGLYAAWCGANCTTISANPGSMNPTTDVLYQYDSHRLPWRIGLDYCWNGTAAARTYLTTKIIPFFANNANAGLNGIGRIADIYSPANGNAASAVVNSASIIGTAAVGAMSDAMFRTFLDDSYQLVLDLLNRGPVLANYGDGRLSAYSYYNATVGMLTLLSMTGNLRPL
jgi:endo-1,4-beta-D-glucanase Y